MFTPVHRAISRPLSKHSAAFVKPSENLFRKSIPSSSFLCHQYATMATDISTYRFNHSMIRVKDPKASVAFYEFLGMKLINKSEQPEAKFDLYFLAYDSPKADSHGRTQSDREGIIELTHNYGTENDPNYKNANGNTEPGKGFGHFCISVDNIQAACKRISDAGYKFQKRLEDGRMHEIAFVLDPDNYWVEIVGQKPVAETESLTTTDVSTYRMNHTMIRVKDAQASLKYYTENFGMKLQRTIEMPSAGFNLYFLSYAKPNSDFNIPNRPPGMNAEGILELTWNYGTEKDASFSYYNGNSGEVQGFGHTCVSVDNIQAACARLEERGVQFKKRLTDGRMKHIAFALDPDGYWVEIIENKKSS